MDASDHKSGGLSADNSLLDAEKNFGNNWLSMKVGQGMMEKIGRSTWARLQKQGTTENLELPDNTNKRSMVDIDNIIEEEGLVEDVKDLKRVDSQE